MGHSYTKSECILGRLVSKNIWQIPYLIQEKSLEAHIRDVINRFVRIGSVDKGKSPRRPSVSEEVVDDLRRFEQNRQTSLTRFPQYSGVPVAI